MKKILVGVDGSEQSNAAARFAASLARATGAQLQISCAIVPPMLYGVDATAEVVAQQYKGARDLAATTLQDVSALLGNEGTAAKTFTIEGPAADALAELATKEDVDLVVVGHRGRNAFARIMLGSVADRLVQISQKPVLVFR